MTDTDAFGRKYQANPVTRFDSVFGYDTATPKDHNKMPEKCKKCKTDNIVIAKRGLSSWDIDGEDKERLDLERYAEVETATVWVMVHFCMKCDQLVHVWIEEVEGEVLKSTPTIVCLCGSTRFFKAFQKANLNETLAGRIVLTIGCDTHSDDSLFENMTSGELKELKERLDKLHLEKIEQADEVLILNVDGYIGESTARELAYAKKLGKRIRFLEE